MMMTDRGAARRPSARPPVSVVVPFLGGRAAARELVLSLERLRLAEGDELIAVDNGSGGALREEAAGTSIRVLEALLERSSYYARNVGAEGARGEWLAFIDADCTPSPSLLDDFLAEPVDPRVGALAGAIRPAQAQRGLLASWAASREILSQERSLHGPGPPAAATANLLVRRAAWEQLGGFLEGLRSGADFEFCWRLADAGWRLEDRTGAAVEHLHRTSLAGIARQMYRYAAGNAWQARRRPGSSQRPRILRGLARSAAGTVGFALALRFRRAALKAVDGVAVAAQGLGRLGSNAAPREQDAARRAPAVLLADLFPLEESEKAQAPGAGEASADWRGVVLSGARADRGPAGRQRLPVSYLEDDGALVRARALFWLAARHPLRVLADLARRRSVPRTKRLRLRDLAPAAWRLRGRRGVELRAAGDGRLPANAARLASLSGTRL
jgi:glycosyltransferase involved in cell wall biosynthesis